MDILKRLDCLAELPSSFYPDYITSWNKAENTDHRSPVLSIILTSFNQGEYLLEALASAEKYRDPNTSELIIIDDGSNDRRTCEVLSNLNNKGYTVYDNTIKDYHRTKQRNKSLKRRIYFVS